MMNKEQVYQFLEQNQISYEAIEHEAVYTVEEANALDLPYAESGTKNLFLRDDKKKNYYLITIRDMLPVNLKELQEKIDSRRLSFASEEDLDAKMKLRKGSVTPFGILNDEERTVKVFIDAYFQGQLISAHPNENTATVFLNCDDLVQVISEHGNVVEYISFE